MEALQDGHYQAKQHDNTTIEIRKADNQSEFEDLDEVWTFNLWEIAGHYWEDIADLLFMKTTLYLLRFYVLNNQIIIE